MRTTTTRATAVAAGTLVLCLTGGGVAAASLAPTPLSQSVPTVGSAPPPGDIVKLVKDTATGVVDKVTTIAGQPGKTPTSAPNREPVATRPARHLTTRPAHVAAPNSPTLGWSLPAGARMSAEVPMLPSAMAAPAIRTPDVAARLAPSAPQSRVVDAASSDVLGSRGGGVVRAMLIALAAASAAALAFGHVTIGRSR